MCNDLSSGTNEERFLLILSVIYKTTKKLFNHMYQSYHY